MGPKGWAKGNAYSSGITKTREGSDSLLTLKTRELLSCISVTHDLQYVDTDGVSRHYSL